MERYTFNFIKDEIQFENFTRDFVKLLYKKLNFQLYGKKGQAQYGVDGYSTEGNIYFQSKHKSKSDLKDKVLLSELNDEFKKAKSKIIESSKNQKSKYLLFTTHRHSTVIQDEAKKISSEEITVEYWGWETIDSYLNDFYKQENHDFFSKYYPELAKNLNNNITPKQLSIKPVNRKEGFIGRETELKSINEKLKLTKALLLSGIAGIGKSSIANQYLLKRESKYSYYGLFEGISSFTSDLKHTLSLSSKSENDLLKEAITKLRTLQGNKLLIIDDISNIDEQFETINLLLSLKDYGFNILFTSRETTNNIEHIELDIMDVDDAKNLFNSIYKVEDKLLEEILGYLDNHTFFIEKTARTLKSKSSLTPEDIKDYFLNGKFAKIKMSRKESFDKFLDQLFTIDDLDAEETLTLKQLTIFPSSFISISDLALILNKTDDTDFEDLLNYLSEKGWLSKYQDNNNQGYKLHQINKEYFFAFHRPNSTDLEIPIKIHLYILRESGDIYRSLLHKNRLIYIEALYKTLKALDIATKEVFILLNQIVNVFFHLGKLNLSLEILTMASKIRQSINSLDDESLSRFHNLSGQLYMVKGDHKKSLEHSELACSLVEKNKSTSPRILAGMYSNLGHVYNAIGDTYKSLKSFRKAQKHITTEDDSSGLSYIYKGIAEAYKISGDYDKALNNFKEALNIRKRFLKIDNPLIAQSYNDLAFIYVEMEQRKKALPLYIKAMKGYEATLGDEHTHTASVYNNLGELYRYIKQYNKAYPLIKKAIDIRELQQEANPIDVASSYNTMGVYYTDINKYDEAINYLTKAHNILNLILGPHHEKTTVSKDNIEYLYSLIANNSIKTTNYIKIGKNSPCSCGSGKKYKRCCGES
ncbi:MAG: tetratricopeptide (TPR) repeat protein [Psychroserpens sp.]|jgi:tetratricopeptide (TPR) repeat protein